MILKWLYCVRINLGVKEVVLSVQRKWPVFICARSGSHRLPKKALMPIKGIPAISLQLKRLQESKLVDQIIFATTDLEEDDQLAEVVMKMGIKVFRGANENVIQRFVDAARSYGVTGNIVRITGDCPFLSGETLDYFLESSLAAEEFDLYTTKGQYPVGVDYEIVSLRVLEELLDKKLDSSDKEWVTFYLFKNKDTYKIAQAYPKPEWRWEKHVFTLDYQDDYDFLNKVANKLDGHLFRLEDILEAVKDMDPHLFKTGAYVNVWKV